MTLDKAIEKLTPYAEGEKVTTELEDLDAIQLGIEALKRCQDQSLFSIDIVANPLPGETKD